MARIRSIKPDFFKNEDLADLDPILRLLFIGLWTQCDREGKMEDRPKRLKIEIFPYDDFDINSGLNLLHEKGFLVRYNPGEIVENDSTVLAQYNNGTRKFIKILTFNKHQQPNVKEAASAIPNPVFISESYEHSAKIVLASQEGKGKEGNGNQERKGEGKEDDFSIPQFDRNISDKIMNYFGFNEISNFDKLRSISAFLNCLQNSGRIIYFENQFDAYVEFKSMNDSFPHSFKNFIGTAGQLFEDGAWNGENWVSKLESEYKSQDRKEKPSRGVEAAMEWGKVERIRKS